MTEVQFGDIGAVFEVTVENEDGIIDVSTASTKKIIFRKSDGTTLIKTASFASDGTDGIIKYVSQEDDIDTLGIWEYQSYTIIGSEKLYGRIFKFRVLRNTTEEPIPIDNPP